MTYIYDILLNFIDGNRVYEFFEWEKQDIVEHIKRIPLFYVNNKTLDDVLNKNVKFYKEFVQSIYNKTIVYENNIENIICYAFLLSNGKRCYGLELDNKGNIIYRSSLLLDEEEEILDICHAMDEYQLNYEVTEINSKEPLLTRNEEKKKNFVEQDLIYTYKSKNYEKLDYLYAECFGNDNNEPKEKYNKLLKSIYDMNSNCRKKLNYILNLANNSNKIYK